MKHLTFFLDEILMDNYHCIVEYKYCEKCDKEMDPYHGKSHHTNDVCHLCQIRKNSKIPIVKDIQFTQKLNLNLLNMELTEEEKMVILKMREEQKIREDSQKIVKVGTLKHDISNGHYIAMDFSNLLDVLRGGGDGFITRKELAKQIKKMDKFFDQYIIKKGSKFFCTIEGGLERWSDKFNPLNSFISKNKKWAKQNLENIQPFNETN